MTRISQMVKLEKQDISLREAFYSEKVAHSEKKYLEDYFCGSTRNMRDYLSSAIFEFFNVLRLLSKAS